MMVIGRVPVAPVHRVQIDCGGCCCFWCGQGEGLLLQHDEIDHDCDDDNAFGLVLIRSQPLVSAWQRAGVRSCSSGSRKQRWQPCSRVVSSFNLVRLIGAIIPCARQIARALSC